MGVCESHLIIEHKQDIAIEQLNMLNEKILSIDKNLSVKINEIEYDNALTSTKVDTEEKRTTKHKEEFLLNFKEINQILEKHTKLLFEGNGSPAIVHTVIRLNKWLEKHDKSYDAWMTWGFRILILIVLGWLGVKQ
jgi:hypothetical protein